MSYDWGPHYIVPSEILKTYSGTVRLRDEFDESLLNKEMETLGLPGLILRVVNPLDLGKKGLG